MIRNFLFLYASFWLLGIFIVKKTGVNAFFIIIPLLAFIPVVLLLDFLLSYVRSCKSNRELLTYKNFFKIFLSALPEIYTASTEQADLIEDLFILDSKGYDGLYPVYKDGIKNLCNCELPAVLFKGLFITDPSDKSIIETEFCMDKGIIVLIKPAKHLSTFKIKREDIDSTGIYIDNPEPDLFLKELLSQRGLKPVEFAIKYSTGIYLIPDIKNGNIFINPEEELNLESYGVRSYCRKSIWGIEFAGLSMLQLRQMDDCDCIALYKGKLYWVNHYEDKAYLLPVDLQDLFKKRLMDFSDEEIREKIDVDLCEFIDERETDKDID